MRDENFYKNKAVAKVLAADVYNRAELIYEVSNFIQDQVARLESERLLSLTDFKFQIYPSTNCEIDIISAGIRSGDHVRALIGQNEVKMTINFGFGFLGIEELVRRRSFQQLGKQAFIERHWEKFAQQLLQNDSLCRAKHKAPLPEGLAAGVSALEIAKESPLPERSAAKVMRSI